jgi:hypothetical protein
MKACVPQQTVSYPLLVGKLVAMIIAHHDPPSTISSATLLRDCGSSLAVACIPDDATDDASFGTPHRAFSPPHNLNDVLENNLLKPLLANQRPSAHRVGPLFAAQLRRISHPSAFC